MKGLPTRKRAVPALSRLKSKALLWAEAARGSLGLGRPAAPPAARRHAARGRQATSPRVAPAQTRVVPMGTRDAASPLGVSEPIPAVDPVFGLALLGLVRALPEATLGQALTHSSWVADRNGSYERLEFLGDSVLGLAVAAALYQRYPTREEGELARIKAFVVSRTSCVQVAQRLGVPRLILEHAPAPEQRRRDAAGSPTILGNMLEALIGACHMTFGFEKTSGAVVEAFEEQFEYAVTAHVDYKTTLQEVLAPRGLQPVYRLVGEEGPPHARTFTSDVSVDGRIRGRGDGTTIKMSEQAAAREALVSLGAKGRGL
jgi:ribonuclease III